MFGGRSSKAEALTKVLHAVLAALACSDSMLKSVMPPCRVPGAFGGLVGSLRFSPGLPYPKFFCVTLEIPLHLNDNKSFKMLFNTTSFLG